MFKTVARFIAVLCGLYVTAAIGAQPPGALFQIPTVSALQSGTYTQTPYINIANYARVGDGGGGTFVPCTSGPCTVDNGVVFQDAAGNKFLRQFKGAVQLPWYGISDAATSACYAVAFSGCFSDTALTAAGAATQTYGNGIVSTGGRSIAISVGYTIPPNVSLTCDGVPGGVRKQTAGASLKYYNLPNSIVMPNTATITVGDNAAFYGCFVRPTSYVPTTNPPSAYNIPFQTTRDIIAYQHTFTGIAVIAGGEACQVHDLAIFGFDTGIDMTGARCVVHNNVSQSNVEHWVSVQRGGGEISTNTPAQMLFAGTPFRRASYGLTNVASDGAGGIKVTVDSSVNANQVIVGDNVIVYGMSNLAQSSASKFGNGDLTVSSTEIDNVVIVGSTPTIGSTIIDRGTAGCVPVNTTITNIMDNGDGTLTLTASNAMTCSAPNEALSFVDTSIAPVGAVGIWVVSNVVGNDIYLKGSSIVGPSFTGASWAAGHPAVTTYDTSNVAGGQYFAASCVSIPFNCTMPTGWAYGTVTGSNLAALGTGTGSLTVSGSLTGWSQVGVFKVDSEVIGYSAISGQVITVNSRGLGGTATASHTNGSTMTTTPPYVTNVAQTEGVATLSVNAQSTSSGTISYLNDPTVNGAFVGQLDLDPTYTILAANPYSGNVVGSALRSPAAGTSGAKTITLGGNANGAKVYEGENVADLTTAAHIPSGTYVDQTPPNATTIHLCVGGGDCSGTLPTTFSADSLTFGADQSCGYPGLITGGTKQFWLGNCSGAAFVFGSTAPTAKSVQGVRCFSNQELEHRIGLRLISAPATTCEANVFGTDQRDPQAAALWISGQGQKIQIVANRFAGGVTNTVIDSTIGTNDDIGIVNNQVSGDIVIAGGAVNLLSAKQSGSGPTPQVLQTATASASALSGNNLPRYSVNTTTDAVDTAVNCDKSNVFATTQCAFASGSFIPTGATSATTLSNFADRALSMLDFGAVPDCTTDATVALTAAETAALAQGVHVIRFDASPAGNCYIIGNHTVAQGIKYYCPGPIPAEPTSNDYRNYPQTIAMSGSTGFVFPANTGMSGCNLIKSNLTSVAPPTTFQDNYARSLALTGTGLTVTGDNVVIENGNIIGFNLGVVTRGSRQATFQNLNVDAITCYTFANQGGGGAHQGVNLQCAPYATRFGTIAEPSYAVTSFADNGSGLLRATLSSACTGTGCPLTGYPVWMANADNLSTQSAIGAWTATVIDSTHIDFQSSTSAFITGGKAEPAVTVTAGSPVISGLTLSLSQVHPTQSVTGACIPAGATIAWTEASYGTIWLDSAHLPTCSSSPTETITIADTAPPAAVSLSGGTVNVGGSGYAVGDTVSPSTGTGTPAVFDVNAVDGSGAVTAIAFDAADGSQGAYTVLPSPLTNSPTTTSGSGTGLTLDLKVASLYASAVVRNGPAFNVNKIVDVRLSNIGELSHSKGISCGFNCRGLIAVNCSLHDENVLQDDTHIGIEFWSNADSNRMSMCDSYYFGAAIAAHSRASTNIAPNVVANSHLGGSAGNSGLQNTLLDVACYDASNTPCPGVAQKSSITLSGDTSQIAGSGMTIMGDSRSVNIVGSSLAATSVYCQNDIAASTLTGSGNSLVSTTSCQSFGTSPASNNVKIQPATTAALLLTVGNCGNTVLSSAAGGTLPVTLPSTAPPGCELTFRPNTNAITLNPNGNTIATNLVSQSSTLTLAAESNGSLVLRFDPSTNRWRVSSCAPSTCTINNLLFGQNVTHGQIYMSCKGTCSGGTGQLQICPYNGPGGLIIGGALYPIPACTYVDNSAFSAVTSALRYVYLFQTTQGVTAMADNGSGKTRLTINSTAGFNTGDPIICSNATGTTSINTATYDSNTTLIDATHIDITDVNWVATGTATCSWIGYAISAAGHVTDANGVEVQSGNGVRTLVGMVFPDASHNLNDTLTLRHVASWFNRQPKKMLAALGANTATTTSTTFKTPTTTAVEGSFLSWGPPGTPSLLPQPAVPWSITAGASATGLASTAQLGACFGTAALGTNASCGSTVETEIASETQAVATDVQSYNLNGQTVTLTEGRNFADIVMNVSTGTLTLAPSATFLGIYVQQ